MAGLKEIRRRIGSVKNTRQITKAMKLVSAAKLRRAQDQALAARDFGTELKKTLQLVLANLPESFSSQLLLKQTLTTPKNIAIVISGERGLCGAFNTNVIKAVLKEKELSSYILFGKRSVAAGKRFQWNVMESFEGLADDSSKWPIATLANDLIVSFLAGQVSTVTLIYTKFVSAMNQQVVSETILPLSVENLIDGASNKGSAEEAGEGANSKDEESIKFAPSAEIAFEKLVPLYISSRIREAVLESKASEHAARMSAMDAATRNAGELLERLKLFYNRARQAAITKELLDIIGGAEAIK